MAEVPNPAVSSDLLKEILNWKQQGLMMKDIITRLRLRTVPPGYTVHNWHQGISYIQGCVMNNLCLYHTIYTCIIGKDETEPEKLRSILAQLDYRHQVNYWHAQGVPFKNHLYVPEIHPETGMGFCEREDEVMFLRYMHTLMIIV